MAARLPDFQPSYCTALRSNGVESERVSEWLVVVQVCQCGGGSLEGVLVS